MKFDKLLIGAKLKDINHEKIVIIDTKGKERTLKFITDDGDWCGFSDVETHLYITQDELKINPVITNVKTKKGNNDCSDELIITLCGIEKKLAKINCSASSGSGWAYGAAVSIRCKALDIDEVLCEY